MSIWTCAKCGATSPDDGALDNGFAVALGEVFCRACGIKFNGVDHLAPGERRRAVSLLKWRMDCHTNMAGTERNQQRSAALLDTALQFKIAIADIEAGQEIPSRRVDVEAYLRMQKVKP